MTKGFCLVVTSVATSAMSMVFSFSAHAAGSSVDRTETVNGLQLHYLTYSPSQPAANPALFVVLHGCVQQDDQFANGTHMNDVAEKNGFYAIYPDQTYQNNNLKCWNFFKPENQTRDGKSELAWIATVTQKVIAEKHIDPSRVFVAGLSAGAAMSANLLACYSELYAGGLIHSGLEFAVAQDATAAQTAMSSGPQISTEKAVQAAYACSPTHPHTLKVIVFHGDADMTVAIANGKSIVQQFVGVNSLITPSSAVTTETSKITQNAPNESADVTDTLFDSKSLVKFVSVEKMGHAWSGGAITVPYMDPKGVDASQIGVAYLLGTP